MIGRMVQSTQGYGAGVSVTFAWAMRVMVLGLWMGAVVMVGGCTPPAADVGQSVRLPRFEQSPDLGRVMEQARQAPLPPGMARVVIDRFEIDSRDREAWELVVRTGGWSLESGTAGHMATWPTSDASMPSAAPTAHATTPSTRMPAGWREHGLAWWPAARDMDLTAALRGAVYARHRREHREQFLLLAPGSIGSIESVRSVVRVTTLRLPQPQLIDTVQVVELQRLGAGFFVQLHGIGPTSVDLTLAPYAITESGRSVGIAGMNARLQVEPGRQYVLMGDRTRVDSFGRSLLSVRRGRVETDVVLILTVQVAAPDGP